MTVLLVLLWLVCAVLTQGIAVAYFQAEYPTIAKKTFRSDLGHGLVLGVFGPLSLVIAFCLSGFAQHGLQWRRK